jgi:F0F1-type ATP synthase membrane subunit b/b'
MPKPQMQKDALGDAEYFSRLLADANALLEEARAANRKAEELIQEAKKKKARDIIRRSS